MDKALDALKATYMRITSHKLLPLFMCVFLLKAFFPAGYMPSVSEDGRFAMTICSIEGLKTIYLDQDPTAPSDHTPDHKEACPYVVFAGSTLDLAPSSHILSEPHYVEVVLNEGYQTPFILTSRTLTYQSRAPPQWS